MKLDPKELSTSWLAIQTSGKTDQLGNAAPRLFPLDQQVDASNIAKTIRACVDAESKFIESEVELTLDQRKLLKECLKREWGVNELEAVLTLRSKLETA